MIDRHMHQLVIVGGMVLMIAAILGVYFQVDPAIRLSITFMAACGGFLVGHRLTAMQHDSERRATGDGKGE